MNRNITVQIFLILTFLLTPLAGVQAASVPAFVDAQVDAIPGFPPEASHGDWANFDQYIDLYVADPGTGGLALSYTPPTATTGSSQSFSIPLGAGALIISSGPVALSRDATILSWTANLRASCVVAGATVSDNSANVATITASFVRLNAANARIDESSANGFQPFSSVVMSGLPVAVGVPPTSSILTPASYSQSADIGTAANAKIFGADKNIFADQKFQMEISATISVPTSTVNETITAGECRLHYGSAANPSNFRVRADTMYVSSWIEDRESSGDFASRGSLITSLPSAATATTSQRQFTGQILASTIWRGDVTTAQPTNLHDNLVAGSRVHIRNVATDARPFDSTRSQAVIYEPDFISPLNGQPSALWMADSKISGPNLMQFRYDFQYPAITTTVPDGRYVFEVVDDKVNTARSPEFTVGAKGIELTLLGSNVRQIQPTESTVYTFTVKNTGAQTDTIFVSSTAATAGFASSLDLQFHTLAPGATSVFHLTVKAPNLLAGSSPVTVTASSQFVSEVSPVSSTVTTQITTVFSKGVTIGTNVSDFIIAPGQTRVLSGVTITNTGTKLDTFLLAATVPAQFAGWNVKFSPASVSVPAGSTQLLTLEVSAPGSAPADIAVPIALKATRLGDNGVSVTKVVTALVERVVSFTVEPSDSLQVRTYDTAYGCEIVDVSLLGECLLGPQLDDESYTQNLVREVVITNTGFTDETYEIEGSWTAGNSLTGNSDCDGFGGNSPEYWMAGLVRTRPSATTGATPFPTATQEKRNSDEVNYGTISIPAGQSASVYLALKWNDPSDDSCALSTIATPVTYRLNVQSIRDNSLRIASSTTVTVVPSGSVQNANTGVYTGSSFVPEISLDLQGSLKDVSAVKPGTSGRHNLMVKNLGNQFDSFRIDIAAGSGSFTRTLSAPTVAGEGNCSQPSPTELECLRLGIGSTVYFDAVTAVSASTPVGTFDSIDVVARSITGAGFTDRIRLTTEVVGDLLFSTQSLDSQRNVTAGQVVNMPFAITNRGTQDDTYNLSTIAGDSNYRPAVLSQEVFVPAGTTFYGSYQVTVPSGASVAEVKDFVLSVASQGNGVASSIAFKTVVRETPAITVESNPSPAIVSRQNNQATFELIAKSKEAGSPAGAVWSLDAGTLPPGFAVSIGSPNTAFTGTTNNWESRTTVTLTAPAGQLGTNLLAPLFKMVSGAVTVEKDALVAFEENFGLRINLPTETTPIVPGGVNTYDFTVKNLGLSADQIRLETLGIPTGWTVTVTPAQANLGPLQTINVQVEVRAPADAVQANGLSFLLRARSLLDSSVESIVEQPLTVGTFSLELDGLTGYNLTRMAIGDTQIVNFVLRNKGNIDDQASLNVVFANAAQKAALEVVFAEPTVVLAPGQNVSSSFTIRATPALTSESRYEFQVVLSSHLDSANTVKDQDSLAFVSLSFKSRDVDGDGIQEVAIDRNQRPADGFEVFQEVDKAGGVQTVRINHLKLLSKEGIQANTVLIPTTTTDNVTGNQTTSDVPTLVLLLDADSDGRVDHYLDQNNDGIPDYYWDPDSNVVSLMKVFKDISADAVLDWFTDVNGDSVLDVVYDPQLGKFYPLVAIDLDDDGKLDYYVDKNGNGILDANESILYSRTGQFVVVQYIDVNGDGKLDQVLDLNGDGIVDAFIASGETVIREIKLQDRTDDGVADWNFDHNGDGRIDRYYDPTTGEVFEINTNGAFLQAVVNYWYVGVLFGLVLVLAGILLVVTRR